MFRRIREYFRRHFPRGRKIRRHRIGAQLTVSCPMVHRFTRPATDCQKCEYNLGDFKRRRVLLQLCGYGLRPPFRFPKWVLAMGNGLRRIRLPKGYVSATFQWTRSKARPLSRIQIRHRERVQKQQRFREQRRRAREARAKVAHPRMPARTSPRVAKRPTPR